ncbi:MAG: hypothetical protein ACRDGM_11020 [bacterium]
MIERRIVRWNRCSGKRAATYLWGAFGVALAGLLAGMTLAIHYSRLQPAWLRVALSVLVPIGGVVVFLFVRPRWWAALGTVAAFALGSGGSL